MGAVRSSLKTDLFRSNWALSLDRTACFGTVLHTARKRLRDSLADNGLPVRAFPRHCWRGSIEADDARVNTHHRTGVRVIGAARLGICARIHGGRLLQYLPEGARKNRTTD